MSCSLNIDATIPDQTTNDSFSDNQNGSHERPNRDLSPRSREELRLRVNARERQRMHDLNSAMDALRQVTLRAEISDEMLSNAFINY